MGQFFLIMRSISITATITLSLLVATSYGGVVRRSIPSSIKSGKDLLSMKGASDAIKRSFKSAGKELEDLAKTLEEEVGNLARLSAYINETQAEKITEALTEAKNINSLMNDQRVELAGLAKTTIKQTDRIVKKFQDIVAKDRELDSGMRSLLRSMKSLLKTSERKLDSARTTINTLREKVNKILATLQVLKATVEEVQKKEAAFKAKATATEVGNILEDVANTVTKGIQDSEEAKTSSASTASIVQNTFSGITKFAVSLVNILKKPDVSALLSTALENIEYAIDVVKKQKSNMEAELAIIIIWRDAVDTVKQDVFDGDLDGDEEDLVAEIEDIISYDDDVNEIYEAFAELKSAAQVYLKQVAKSCPYCAA